jgi:hypothetical protein
MKISNTELRSCDMHGQIDFASARKVFNIAVASVFRPGDTVSECSNDRSPAEIDNSPARNCSSSFFPHLRLDLIRGSAGMDALF